MPANTSPDNIQFPTAGDQIAPLNTVFQNVAQTTQNALSLRANFSYRWANAAARTAQTGMRNGDRGFQIDTAQWYERIASAWVLDFQIYSTPFSMAAGFTAINQEAIREGRSVTATITVNKSSNFGNVDIVGTIIPELRPRSIVAGGGFDNNTVAPRANVLSANGNLQVFGAAGRSGIDSQVLTVSYTLA
jgi:hypothetical protein